MKVVYSPNPKPDENRIINEISRECGILYDTARLLYARNVNSVEKAKRFLSPLTPNFNDAFLLSGMSDAVSRIKKAKENNEKVLIFGDYDADGISAVTTLYFCLKHYGITASVAVPERSDGYGLNVNKIEEILSNGGVLITVDCGVSENEKIDYLQNKGIDVIVTDHHEPPEILPNCIVINPKIKGQQYPFDGLCGAGVAYKLGYALIGNKANDYLDYVALATIADSMDLVDENRTIVSLGLKIFNSSKCRVAFRDLLNDSKKEITSQTLAFVLAPRVNAGGRMGDAKSTLDLFLSNDRNEIFNLAVKTNEYNIARQTECDNIYREASAIIKETKLYQKEVILIKNERWGAGFIGIVAARLVEDYAKPVIVFSKNDGYYKGSARSVEGINIYQAIASAKDILITYGGHSQAAGVSVTDENFVAFEEKLCEFVRDNATAVKSEKIINAEWEINGEIPIRFAEEIGLLEPFGTGNKKPVFTIKVNSVLANRLKENSPHYVFKVCNMDMFNFNGDADVLPLLLPVEKTIVFEAGVSEFRHVKNVKGIIKRILKEDVDFSTVSDDVFRNELLKIKTENFDKFETIKEKDVKIEEGYETLFVLSDYRNVERYDVKNLPIYLFNVGEKKPINAVVVSPESISDEYKNIIYLDKPLVINDSKGKVSVVNEVLGSANAYDLSVDRSDFAKVYDILVKNQYQPFMSSADFYRKNDVKISGRQFVFCVEVFFELGLIFIKNGKLFIAKNVKNPLENSKIYQTIANIKNKL